MYTMFSFAITAGNSAGDGKDKLPLRWCHGALALVQEFVPGAEAAAGGEF